MLKYAWREIIRRKGRSVAAILSYALATMIFSVLISLLQYTEYSEYKTLYNTGTHFIAFSPVCCNLPLLRDETHEGFWANGGRSSLIPLEMIDTIRNLHSVRDASPALMFRLKDSLNNVGLTLSGFDPLNTISVANTICSATDIISGRYISPDDSNAIMVEESYARSHKLLVGKSLILAGIPVSIIGIVQAGIRPVKADLYTTFQGAERIINRRTWNPLNREMNIILVESANAQVHNQAILDVKNILGKDNIISSYSCHTPAREAMNLNRQMLWLGVIFVTIFIIVHVTRNQYASLVERRREIGILQSMGWSGKRIVATIGNEFLLQAFIGGIFGGYFAILSQLAIPKSSSSCHILCAIDCYGNTLIGFGIIMTLVGFLGILLTCISVRLRPIKNLQIL